MESFEERERAVVGSSWPSKKKRLNTQYEVSGVCTYKECQRARAGDVDHLEVLALPNEDMCQSLLWSTSEQSASCRVALIGIRQGAHKLNTASCTLVKSALGSVGLTNSVPSGHPSSCDLPSGF